MTKKYLVVANPISGGGRSLKTYSLIKPLLDEANIPHVLETTKSSQHAFQIGNEIDINEFEGIISISGDGMFHEIVNGVCKREDKDEALKALKFGIIPSGTGNGLSASLGHGRDITNAVESIIKGSVSQVDLLEIKDYKTNEHITYGALAVSWGFVSDFDYLTEQKYRWMGPSLSTFIAPLINFAKKNIYKGKISYIPAGQEEKEEEWKVIEGEFWGLTASNGSHIAVDCHIAPAADLDGGCVDLVFVLSCGVLSVVDIFLSMEKGEHRTHEAIKEVKTKKFILEPTEGESFIDVDGELFPSKAVLVEVVPAQLQVYTNKAAIEKTKKVADEKHQASQEKLEKLKNEKSKESLNK